MSVNQILKAAREMREAARYWEPESRTDAEHAAWPQNKEAAQRYLDALKAWDDLIESMPKFDTGDPYVIGVHGPAPRP
jgi:hypothetical protein